MYFWQCVGGGSSLVSNTSSSRPTETQAATRRWNARTASGRKIFLFLIKLLLFYFNAHTSSRAFDDFDGLFNRPSVQIGHLIFSNSTDLILTDFANFFFFRRLGPFFQPSGFKKLVSGGRS